MAATSSRTPIPTSTPTPSDLPALPKSNDLQQGWFQLFTILYLMMIRIYIHIYIFIKFLADITYDDPITERIGLNHTVTFADEVKEKQKLGHRRIDRQGEVSYK